jgi:hypothetical protein
LHSEFISLSTRGEKIRLKDKKGFYSQVENKAMGQCCHKILGNFSADSKFYLS